MNDELVNVTIPAGEHIIITAGEWSAYQVIGLFVADVDINIEALKDEYLLLYPDQKEPYHFEKYKFVNWLCNGKCIVKEIDSREWSVGAYACSDHSFFTETIKKVDTRED